MDKSNLSELNCLDVINFYVRLIDDPDDAIFIEKTDGRIVDVNTAACKMLQYSREELLKMNVADLLPDPNVPTEEILQEELRTGGRSFAGFNVRKDGTHIPVEVIIREFDNAGEKYLLVIVRDISKRLMADRTLRKNQYLNALHEISVDLLRRVELKDVLVNIVSRACELLGTPDGIICLIDESDNLVKQEVGVGRYASRPIKPFELGQGLTGKVAKSGQALVVEDYANWPGRAPHPMFDDLQTVVGIPLEFDGRVHGVISVQFPFSPRHFTEDELAVFNQFAKLASIAFANAKLYSSLAESENRYRTVFDASTEAIELYDAETLTLIDANQKAADLHRMPRTELLTSGLSFLESSEAGYSAAKAMELLRLAADGAPQRFEWPIKDRQGNDCWLDINLQKVTFDNRACILAVMRDITERILVEKQLRYFGLHDILTGLHNRAYFQSELERLQEIPAVAAGLAICDVDGLKLVNDAFGHHHGDALLINVATILNKAFKGAETVARIGGDEFAVLLTGKPARKYQTGISKITRMIVRHNDKNPSLPISISFGFAQRGREPLDTIALFKEADDNMYKEKQLQQRSGRSNILQVMLKTLESRDSLNDESFRKFADLLNSFALSVGMSTRETRNLYLLAQFHDIGKIGVPGKIVFKRSKLTAEEKLQMRKHCTIGYRIAKALPELQPVAEWILKHHEHWDGSGYPLGLRSREIPLPCRVFAIANAFNTMTSERPYSKAATKEAALEMIKSQTGIQFDPKLVNSFIKSFAK